MLKASYYTEPTEVDQLVFEKLVPPEHYLRQVKRLIDFERFRNHVQDCYSAAMGRSAEDPVRLIKLEFLQFHYQLSDRDVIAAAQVGEWQGPILQFTNVASVNNRVEASR